MGEYPFLAGASVLGVDVPSGVPAQPKGLEETLRGALNRAKAALGAVPGAALGFGVESGIFPVAGSRTGWMDTTACAVWDGAESFVGFSSCFEYPDDLTSLMHEKGLEVTDAALELGYSDDPKFGAKQGMVGVLTKGRLDRAGYSFQALRAALIHLENRAG